MIKKIIACADVHIPPFKKIDELHTSLERFIEQCKGVVEEAGGPEFVRIVVCGDIFDAKLSITNESILEVNWFFSELDNICRTYVMAGNHDFIMNNLDRVDSLTPLFEIGKYKNVTYMDQVLNYKSGTITDDNVTFCLYSSFEEFKTPDIAAERELHKDNVFVGVIHGDINGATTALARVTENGIDPSVFDGCDFVLAGHIHKWQAINKNGVNVVYCSSLKQKDFGETVTGHGFVLWTIGEDGNNTFEYVETDTKEGGFYKFVITDKEDIINDKEKLLNF